MAQLIFPLQYKRQYAGPLDADSTFATLEELNAYLASPLRYAGQIATCNESEGQLFVLNNARDAWLSVQGGGGLHVGTEPPEGSEQLWFHTGNEWMLYVLAEDNWIGVAGGGAGGGGLHVGLEPDYGMPFWLNTLEDEFGLYVLYGEQFISVTSNKAQLVEEDRQLLEQAIADCQQFQSERAEINQRLESLEELLEDFNPESVHIGVEPNPELPLWLNTLEDEFGLYVLYNEQWVAISGSESARLNDDDKALIEQAIADYQQFQSEREQINQRLYNAELAIDDLEDDIKDKIEITRSATPPTQGDWWLDTTTYSLFTKESGLWVEV